MGTLLAMMQDKTLMQYENYDALINVMMDMNGMTREQAEDAFLKRLMKDMPSFKNSDDILRLMAGTNLLVLRYYNEMAPAHKAMMEERSWKEVLETLKQSPAYKKYNNYYSENFRVNMDLEMIRKHFVTVNGENPANIQKHIETLVGYMKNYAEVYYRNNSGIQQRYNQAFVNRFIDYGKTTNRYGMELAEQAAYETVLYIYTKFNNDLSTWNWNGTDGSRLRWYYDTVLDLMAKNK